MANAKTNWMKDASGTIFIPKLKPTGSTNKPIYISTSGDITECGPIESVKNNLSFGTKTYNGSTPQIITAADLGIIGAMVYKGTSSTEITDGGTQVPKIGSTTIAIADLKAGNVVLYGQKEFVWNGSKWELLGDEGSYKVKQDAVTTPGASGNSSAFIDTITQDANGKIAVTKKNVDFAAINTDLTTLKNKTQHITANADETYFAKDVKVADELITDKIKTTQAFYHFIDGSNKAIATIDANGVTSTSFNGALNGNANTATKLATARTIQTNLASTSSASFDGSGNVTPGVSGVLGIVNGGTGNSAGYIRTGQKAGSTIGNYATAEGYYTTASGIYSHAEGHSTTASGKNSHAEGWSSLASGENSHAEGNDTGATGLDSHAEGWSSLASGDCSHAEGATIASGMFQHTEGVYNIEDTEDKYIHIAGNGLDLEPSNAHTLDWDGNAWYQGGIKTGGNDFDDANYAVIGYKGSYEEQIVQDIGDEWTLINHQIDGIDIDSSDILFFNKNILVTKDVICLEGNLNLDNYTWNHQSWATFEEVKELKTEESWSSLVTASFSSFSDANIGLFKNSENEDVLLVLFFTGWFLEIHLDISQWACWPNAVGASHWPSTNKTRDENALIKAYRTYKFEISSTNQDAFCPICKDLFLTLNLENNGLYPHIPQGISIKSSNAEVLAGIAKVGNTYCVVEGAGHSFTCSVPEGKTLYDCDEHTSVWTDHGDVVANASNNHWQSLTSNGSIFAACESNHNGYVSISKDGINWSDNILLNANYASLYKIKISDDKKHFIVFRANSTDAATYISEDGENFIENPYGYFDWMQLDADTSIRIDQNYNSWSSKNIYETKFIKRLYDTVTQEEIKLSDLIFTSNSSNDMNVDIAINQHNQNSSAHPDILSTIEGLVNKSGDTMTGNLIIEKAEAPSFQGINTTTSRDIYMTSTSDSYATVANRISGDQNNRVALWLAPETETNDKLLRIHKEINGTENTYKVYHEGNKPTPADIGATQIITGNYIGTGTSGPSNPNTLTFAFKPCLVIICSDHHNQLMFINPSEVDAFAWGSSPDVKVSWGAKSVSWYSGNSNNGAGYQLNSSGKTYNYVAIG